MIMNHHKVSYRLHRLLLMHHITLYYISQEDSHSKTDFFFFSSGEKFGLCICSVCVRAQATRVHVRIDACARRRRIAVSNRTVQQAQAARRAGEAAKNYSSRYLKLRGEQRERRNFSVHGKSRHVGLFSPISPQKSAFGCLWLFYFHFFSSLLSFPSLHTGSRGARCMDECRK